MKYSDETLNKIMPILEKKMEGFSTGRIGICPRVYDEDEFRKYIHSVGGSVMDDFYPRRRENPYFFQRKKFGRKGS